MKFFILATAVLFSVASYSPAAAESTTSAVTIENAEKFLAEGAQLLDERTKEEWDEGHAVCAGHGVDARRLDP